jgi:hypothetical protein
MVVTTWRSCRVGAAPTAGAVPVVNADPPVVEDVETAAVTAAGAVAGDLPPASCGHFADSEISRGTGTYRNIHIYK